MWMKKKSQSTSDVIKYPLATLLKLLMSLQIALAAETHLADRLTLKL
jgi:hypothetical protein